MRDAMLVKSSGAFVVGLVALCSAMGASGGELGRGIDRV
jgi:hypothetical protein